MIKIKITRFASSYQYKLDPARPSSYENNIAHNSEDIFELVDNDEILFKCTCQSVHNLDWGDNKSNGPLPYGDTIAPGNFLVRTFCEPRNYHNAVHEIFNAVDLDGHEINKNSLQYVNGISYGRWLIHDRFSEKTGKDTVNAWSAGCIILKTKDLEALNQILTEKEFRKGFVLPATIKEV